MCQLYSDPAHTPLRCHVWSKHWHTMCSQNSKHSKITVKILTNGKVFKCWLPRPQIHDQFEQVDYFGPAHKIGTFFIY